MMKPLLYVVTILARMNGSVVSQVFFESNYQLALINYIEGNYQDAYTLLEIIYANEKGFPKSSNSVLFGAYILGAAATHQMGESIVSGNLYRVGKWNRFYGDKGTLRLFHFYS